MSNDGKEEDGMAIAPSIGPSLPPHIAVKMSSESKAAIGPSLPPHLQQNDGNAEPVNPPKRVMGPTMPPSIGEEEPKLSAAEQAFLDREKRMKEASQREAAGVVEPIQEETGSRPEWMLAPPTAQSFSEVIQKDQSAALKSRGFSQAQNVRVQKGKGGSGLGGIGEDDSSLWTETPQERAKRLMEEELGIRAKGDSVQIESEEDRAKRRADEEREKRLQEAIAEHAATRGPSLLEQHQAKRRNEIRSKDKDGKEERSSHRRRREERDSDSSREDDRHKKRDRHRDGRRSDGHRRHKYSDSESNSEADKRSKSDRHKSRNSEKVVEREGDRHRRHRRSHRTESEERDRDRRKREREKEREKKEKKKRREQEEKEEKKGAPMMVWDRDAAMSVGGRLLDDQKRMETIRSASTLGSRFGGGSSRYL